MKMPLYLSPCTRGCLLIFVFTTLSASNARCGFPFKRTLGAIKERVVYVVRKIGSGIDHDASGPNQQSPHERELEYGPHPLSQSPLRQSSKPDDSSRNGSEILYSAPAGEPSIVLRNPQSSTTGTAVVTASEQSQRVGSSKLPPLRELPVNGPSDSQASPSNAVDQGSKNPAGTQASPATTPISYAISVAGHPGFVYPPGVKEELKNMLDVRGCTSGEKMRDPRTGSVFLVP